MSKIFWKTCKTCKGTGTLRVGHPDAARTEGYKTKVIFPAVIGGHSGELIADPGLSYCGKCHGTGMKP